jgi:hypothetical protein
MISKGIKKKDATVFALYITAMIVFWLVVLSFGQVASAKSTTKAKFYDFSEQLIDGEINKPTALYTDARERVRFNRLLKLKKSFIPILLRTSKETIFR